MGFKIVRQDSPNPIWVPVGFPTTAATVYPGQIVKWSYDGIMALGSAGAGPDVTQYPFGIVRALNNRTPVPSSTYNAFDSVTTAQAQATNLARDFAFTGGMVSPSDPRPMALVDLLFPSTVIEGPIRNAAIGTAPGVVTCTTASTTGISSMVHGSADVTLVANNNQYYCRSGANQGLYRSSYAGSATTPTFYMAWPYDWAVGDTFVATNVGLGDQKIDFDSANMWVENSAALSNYFAVRVISMDLRVAGQETVQFSFIKFAD